MNGRTVLGNWKSPFALDVFFFFCILAAGCNGIPNINKCKKQNKKQANNLSLYPDLLFCRVSGLKLRNSTSGRVKEWGTSQFLIWAAQLRIDSACDSIPLPSHTLGLPTWLYFAKDYSSCVIIERKNDSLFHVAQCYKGSRKREFQANDVNLLIDASSPPTDIYVYIARKHHNTKNSSRWQKGPLEEDPCGAWEVS